VDGSRRGKFRCAALSDFLQSKIQNHKSKITHAGPRRSRQSTVKTAPILLLTVNCKLWTVNCIDETAREQLAELIGTHARDVIFTWCATEAAEVYSS
jgi:hypothetical protein